MKLAMIPKAKAEKIGANWLPVGADDSVVLVGVEIEETSGGFRVEFKKDIDHPAEAMKETGAEAELIDLAEMLGFPPMGTYVLTTTSRYYGAAALCTPRGLELLREKGGNWFVLPSSVHDVIAVPADNFNTQELIGMVRDINRNFVLDEDKLSDNVYWTDGYTIKSTKEVNTE